MLNPNILLQTRWGILLLAIFGLVEACNVPTATPAVKSIGQKLRIVNAGKVDIADLVVLFPGPTADAAAVRIEFGNVSAGKTTEYQSAPRGVYRYAGRWCMKTENKKIRL